MRGKAPRPPFSENQRLVLQTAGSQDSGGVMSDLGQMLDDFRLTTAENIFRDSRILAIFLGLLRKYGIYTENMLKNCSGW